MYRIGAYDSGEGEKLVIYEVNTSKFYRYDICNEDAPFHTAPEEIIYSTYSRKKKYTFGDRAVFEEVSSLQRRLQENPAKTEIDTNWKDGAFFMTHTKAITPTVFSQVVYKNGKLYKEIYREESKVYMMITQEDVSEFTMEPVNANEYISNDIEKKIETNSPYVPLEVLKVRFNIKHLFTRDYQYVKNTKHARDLINAIRNAKDQEDPIGVDTETNNVDFNLYGTGKLVGIIVSLKDDQSWYFPFGHNKSDNLPEDILYELLDALHYVEDNSTGHGVKFETKVFMSVGKKIRIKNDSMQASIINNPKMIRGAHALKPLVEEVTKEKYLEFSDIFLSNKNINFADLDEDLITAYACPDSPNSRIVLYNELEKMPKYQNGIYQLECELTHIKAEQEYWGFRIDDKEFLKSSDNCNYILSYLEEAIYSITKRKDFKITSPDDLRDLLYNKMKCKVYVRTKTGKASTGSRALTKLSHEYLEEPRILFKTDIRDKEGNILIKARDLNTVKYPLVLFILAHRKYSKLRTAFYDRIENASKGQFERFRAGALACVRYFTWINQNGAESGRQSSPLHQMPYNIKHCILPDSEDHDLIDADFSAIELRILPFIAKEPKLIELCKDPDVDIHRAIGSLITGKPIWAISAGERKKGKSRNFGVVYMISAKGLAEQMYGAGADKKQIKQCQKSIDEFFHTFKRITKFLRENRETVLREGKMLTFWKRARYFYEIFDKDISDMKKASLIRQANNLPVQGTAADFMKTAECRYQRYIEEKGWDELVQTPQGKFPLVRLMVSIHDEVLISAHKSIPIEEIFEMQRYCQELDIKGCPPLFANPAIIDNWGEGKDDRYEVPRELRARLINNYHKTGKSAFSTTKTRKLEMLNAIEKFKDEEIKEYMEELIAEVGLDSEAIAEKVRHPRLTHELISRYKQTEDHKKEHGELEHIEHIQYSVNRYLAERSGEIVAKVKEEHAEGSDEELRQSILEITGASDELVEVDQDGNVVYSDIGSDPDDTEEDYLLYDDDKDNINSLTSYIQQVVWELFDNFTIDTSGLSMEECDELLAILDEYHVKDGFSTVNFLYSGKLIDTGIRVEDLDKDRIEEFIKSKTSKLGITQLNQQIRDITHKG